MTVTTLTDQKTIEQLERGREALLKDTAKGSVMDIIRRKLGTITRNVYVLYWTPDQCEDFCGVLVDGATVVQLEIPRKGFEGEVLLECMTLQEYRKRRGRMSRLDRRRLDLTIEMAKSHTERRR